MEDFWKKNKNLITISGFFLAITSLFLSIPQPNNESAKFALSYLIISFLIILFALFAVIILRIYDFFLDKDFNKNRPIHFFAAFFCLLWGMRILYYLGLFTYFSYEDIFFTFLEKFIQPFLWLFSLTFVLLIMYFAMKIFKKYLRTKPSLLDVVFILSGFYAFNFIFLTLSFFTENGFSFVPIKYVLTQSIRIHSFSHLYLLVAGVLSIVIFYYLQKERIISKN